MQLLSSILLAAVFALGVAEAKPSKTSPSVARNEGKSATKTSSGSCNEKEFWYETRSCCLTNGGPSSTPTPPSGISCPSAWYFHHSVGCCVPSKPSQTATPPTCSKKGWSWSHGLQCCTPEHTTSAPSATASSKAYSGKKSHNKVKRSYDQWDASMCPTGLTTCPIKVNGAFVGDSECVDTLSDLTSCGGCVSLGKGADCSKVAHATSSSCMGGVCVVGDCASGFKPSDDESSCVAA